MSEINVFMYGGKGILSNKETPLKAEVVSCSMADKCSFFKEGTCLSVRGTFLSDKCKFANVKEVKGYTRKAKKYYEFKDKWSSHPLLNKLDKAPKKLGLIDDLVVLPYMHMVIVLQDDGSIKMDYPYKSKGIQYIPLEYFTVDNIYIIAKNKPEALMGGVISSYQEEVVPKFLSDLKVLMPNLYEKFTSKYKEFKEKEVNYIGRKAYLKTVKPNSVFVTDKESWEWDGEKLFMIKGPKPYFNIISNHYEVESHELVLTVDDKTIIKITDNSQVIETTKFAD